MKILNSQSNVTAIFLRVWPIPTLNLSVGVCIVYFVHWPWDGKKCFNTGKTLFWRKEHTVLDKTVFKN